MLQLPLLSAAAFSTGRALRRVVAEPWNARSVAPCMDERFAGQTKSAAAAERFAGQTKSAAAAAVAVQQLDGEIPLFDWGAGQDQLPAEELEALFYQYDRDSDGEIDKDELAEALFRAGYRIERERFDDLFVKFDTDGSASGESRPERSVKFAMDLFKSYDVDTSGSIDKYEFAELAAEIEANYKRRTALVGVAAGLSALAAQKTFRGLYIERRAEEAQGRFFPTALLSSDLDEAIARTLYQRGFTPQNTLFAHSVCSDEVNNKDEQLVDVMGFSLGGLGGLPFAGKSGFRAYLHHVPDSGKLLILFAPHVGIDGEGRVGRAAARGAEAAPELPSAIQAKAEQARKEGLLPPSAELGIIIDLLTPRLKGLEQAAEPITFVTYMMYTIVRDLLDNCIKETPDVWEWASEVALVGGVMVNRKSGGDFFQPLSFELRRSVSVANGRPTDVYREAFGPRPDLLPILGSEDAVRRVLGPSKPGEGAVSL
ncbi:hypothetical protein EMIHUDRAFT_197387 [Emiliania huxleyi CCMP1516]|uniref:EF-hand domain-containing protein n=2 Tax=Emiliania huxleyi TaxID=2903 RepID=A0A0D3IU76_EMIH1|nr:hypothetical protein EMIHUDRAFT_197387 [Emiliania huxleyi CCMP1516]EOD14811.1 hypothetical protein EMIHUDRAFT_197387 [Emiliania huxleyi CCMP1516]|eukprot:XP_005767240.1 hypothetical protein EMIHUDRAFT_197387 [Emiliania huxleyi CCMP1516]